MIESLPTRVSKLRGDGDFSLRNLLILLLLTVFAFLVMGYHPGLEDDAFYLAAIKRNLNPALFPHDSEYFRLQFQATIFDKIISASVRLTHLPLSGEILLWQLAAIFFLLHGVWRISRRCFSDAAAQWGSVALVAVLLTLPLPGIGINLADQYLHPRTLATAAILGAIVAVIDKRLVWAGFLLAIAFSIHAIMASFGISFCFFLWCTLHRRNKMEPKVAMLALLVPLGWIFEPASDAWRKAASTRGFYLLSSWHWYEWLGVFAPLILLYIFRRIAERSGTDRPVLRALISAVLYYGVFQMIVGLVIMLPPSLERLRPFEPMRYLHLVYLLFFFVVGGLLGQYVFKRRVYRWVLLLLPLSAGMFFAQRQMYRAYPHLELPGAVSVNPWSLAFSWIRQNTPADSLFAVDPHYMTLPYEEYHGFRALAERSVLADYEKDGGMAARVPRIAPRWLKEVSALDGWRNFQSADFHRLKSEFGVDWIVLARPGKPDEYTPTSEAKEASPPGMTCPYQNRQVRVCRLY